MRKATKNTLHPAKKQQQKKANKKKKKKKKTNTKFATFQYNCHISHPNIISSISCFKVTQAVRCVTEIADWAEPGKSIQEK